MTDVDEWDDEYPNPMLDGEDDGDWRDYDDDYRELDPEDHEIARAYEDLAEHCADVHGGGECDCRPTLRDRLAWEAADAARRLGNARARVTIALRGVYTVRLGRAELTLRLNADRACGACGGKGWFYTLDRGRADDRPPDYNGTALCGCGSATTALAETRRDMRQWRKEPPF